MEASILEGPPQFIFLVGAATTGLTLIVIINRIRDLQERYHDKVTEHRRNLEAKFLKLPPERSKPKPKLKNLVWLKDYCRVGYKLAFAQLVLLNLILGRVVWSAYFGHVPRWYDHVIVGLGFATMGVGWILYFLWVTWPAELQKISEEAGIINFFKRRRRVTRRN
jgi:hypothetical protein